LLFNMRCHCVQNLKMFIHHLQSQNTFASSKRYHGLRSTHWSVRTRSIILYYSLSHPMLPVKIVLVIMRAVYIVRLYYYYILQILWSAYIKYIFYIYIKIPIKDSCPPCISLPVKNDTTFVLYYSNFVLNSFLQNLLKIT